VTAVRGMHKSSELVFVLELCLETRDIALRNRQLHKHGRGEKFERDTIWPHPLIMLGTASRIAGIRYELDISTDKSLR
jgi:hypothetical protein